LLFFVKQRSKSPLQAVCGRKWAFLIFPIKFDEILGKKKPGYDFPKARLSQSPLLTKPPHQFKIINFKLRGGISIVKKNIVVQKNLFTNNKNLGDAQKAYCQDNQRH
jgi:hypothetical protein